MFSQQDTAEVVEINPDINIEKTVSDDGTFASSGAPISKPPPWGLKKHLKESQKIRNRKFEQRFARMATPEPMGNPLMMRTFLLA